MSGKHRKSRDWNRPGYPAVTLSSDVRQPHTRGRDVAIDVELANDADLVEPNLARVLVGYTVIADLDLVVDVGQERVVPRDPRGPIYEI
jgi:hypothetical protein